MPDQHLTCVQCGASFLFSQIEQERFAARGFDPPRRCPNCRKSRNRLINDNGWQPKHRREHRHQRDE